MENAAKEVNDMRCWSDLLYDILALIGKKLTIADHVSFRAVCKDWRLASKICYPVDFQQFTTESLWLMFLRNPKKRSAQWEIGDPSSGCIFTIDIPLLSARTTRCLLSKHGWLLLFSTKASPSLFFFNPLSQARMDLPWCDACSGLKWHRPKHRYLPVFAISSPPTSHDCVVLSVRMLQRTRNYEICMIGRGESNWKMERGSGNRIDSPIVHAVFYKGVLYWKTGSRCFRQSKPKSSGLDYLVVKYLLEMSLERVFSTEKGEKIITTPPVKEWSRNPINLFWVDTLPIGACCASVDGHKLVGWHFWDKSSCPHTCGNHRGNSFWIEPKWSKPSADLKWSTIN